ncbi:MAG: hydroxymethylglutaryl-CoA reductase [Acidobacteriota bacterium]|nr:hydroxymethylglutaryl-CoA reductase [Acidobacteriota bacterium]
MSGKREVLKLVPRARGNVFSREDMDGRRAWVEEAANCSLQHVGACTLPAEDLRGNIENPIGTVQMPLGAAGPLQVNGEHAMGRFYVPLATTEGALVRSYERGMVTITRSGGADVRILDDSNVIDPTFFFQDTAEAARFARQLPERLPELQAVAQGTTRHGKLLHVTCRVSGRQVIASFRYHTGDAHGMNMIAKATHEACEWVKAQGLAPRYLIFSGMACEKRAGGYLFGGGKGKKVTAGATIPAKTVRSYLHATPQQIHELWQTTVSGHLQGGAVGYNGHLANGLTALFIATGQDVANVVNSSVGVTSFEVTSEGDLFASVNLASLTVATVGGGTALGTSRECLAMLDCVGGGKAKRLAEITAATLLAGELSFGAAIASGEFVDAHEAFGRNRPEE